MLKLQKTLLFCSAILAFMCLFVPFVHIKVGPEGYAYYGPNVPDIYIYGHKIFGKTPSEWIRVWQYQRIIILFVSITSFLISIFNLKKNLKIFLIILNTIFLGLFPYYIKILTAAIWSNSDGLTSDGKIVQCIGFYFYYGILALYVITFLIALSSMKLPKLERQVEPE